jgi:hypothetical protein
MRSPSGAGAMAVLDVNAVDGAGVLATTTTTVSATSDTVIDVPFTSAGMCGRLETRIQVLSGELCYRAIDVR